MKRLRKFKIITLPYKVEKSFPYFTKLSLARIGAGKSAKGSLDLAEAVACQDRFCWMISAIGLQICTSFITGPNLTAVVTLPVLFGCKVLVDCCKLSKLSWGGC